MLEVLDIKEWTLCIFNLTRRTFTDLIVRAGIESYMKIIPHLVNAIEIWNRNSDDDQDDSIELRLVLGYNIP